jgi:hypothetical protein
MRSSDLLFSFLSVPLLAQDTPTDYGNYYQVAGAATQQIRYLEADLISEIEELRGQLTGTVAERREPEVGHSRHFIRMHIEVGGVKNGSRGYVHLGGHVEPKSTTPFLFFGPFVSADKGLGVGFRAVGGIQSGPVWAGLSAETATGLKPALGLRIAVQF